MYTKDHGWMFNLFGNGNKISGFMYFWDPELIIDDRDLKIQPLERCLLSPNTAKQLNDILSLMDLDDIIEQCPAKKFAELLSLEYYGWMSGVDIATRSDDFIGRIPGAEYIDI